MASIDHDTVPATAAGRPWDEPTPSLFLTDLGHAPSVDGSPTETALGGRLDTWDGSLFSLRHVGIDIPQAAGPAPTVPGTLPDGAASVPNSLNLSAAFASIGPARVPAATQSPAGAPEALNTTTMVAPQVLASGTWLANPQVTLKTSLGNVVVELYPNAAPVTVANHLAYVSSGFFDDLLFHRVVPGFVVQGGGFASGMVYQTPPYAPIKLESNNGLSNDRGTLAMARTNVPDSATSQFFFNQVNNTVDDIATGKTNLNYVSPSKPGYAVFGKVLTGLSVVDAIAEVPTLNGVPRTDVKILEADQTKQGTLHNTSGRVDLGILAGGPPVWTGAPDVSWQYSLNAGASWTQGAGRSFTVPLGAYEAGSIQVRYLGAQNAPGTVNGTGGNMVVDARAIKAGDGGANALTGTTAADNLYGLGGNDTLDGGSGNDSLVGGTGNDTYVVQSPGDKTVEAAGGGTDTVNASATFTLPSNVEKLVLTGTGTINGTGNTLANTITGNSGNNVLSGGSGNDTLVGGSGNDSLDGGSGNDSLVGGTGNDRYTVDSPADKISETTTAAAEIDSVLSSVTWTLGSNLENLTLTGGSTINGTGNALANAITGNTGNNVLSGGSGNDTLNGGSGNDNVDGGTGNDRLDGGIGADTFRFTSALNGTSNVDTISSFVAADDTIQLENSVFLKLVTTGTLSSSFFRANNTGLAVDGNDYIVYETDTGKLFYDADGNGAGAAVLFATLTGAPVVSSLDFFVT